MSTTITRAMKPHTVADELLLPTAKHFVGVMIGDECVNNLNGIYISFETVHSSIVYISADILDQMIQENTLNESSDFEKGSQLLVYAVYIHESVVKTSLSSINFWKQLPRHVI
ncbi:hypothetical protein RF11_16510 [Thelohanellus kitauei]|uniref:Uncharacterized protein n=1 Tax=Thelohanellus kitauei TaxID=669202 RepID=A0A0C2MU54_THEKT|nr:hypothetical protein RF11_16510 [Thelohanellus kitauei]